HPQLPPFPTRRSSDLETKLEGFFIEGLSHLFDQCLFVRIGAVACGQPKMPCCSAVRRQLCKEGAQILISGLQHHPKTRKSIYPADRKSTRLNSSHQII